VWRLPMHRVDKVWRLNHTRYQRVTLHPPCNFQGLGE